ncbi:sialate O-acetylesterase [Rheinheimera riviphila]|nr:sialate O-acetylesterase [Rheinheimera riviphila]
MMMTTIAVTAAAAPEQLVLAPLFSDQMVLQREQPLPIWGQAAPGSVVTLHLLDAQGAAITSASGEAIADDSGHWQITLPALPAAGPLQMEVATARQQITVKDVWLGDVWLASGQSNMEWPLSAQTENWQQAVKDAAYPKIRFLKVPNRVAATPQRQLPATPLAPSGATHWLAASAETVPDFSAIGWYFAKQNHLEKGVAVGVIDATWGGTVAQAWTPAAALWMLPAYQQAATAVIAQSQELAQALAQQIINKTPNQQPHWLPGVLFNAMIKPLVPYGLKGVLWYQGESNVDQAVHYHALFSTLIQSWRDEWQQPLPFLYVQLASYLQPKAQPAASAWAELREAQFQTLQLPATAMVVTTDLGDANDIHPARKKPVAERLWLAARRTVFGEAIIASGPVFSSLQIEGKQLRVRFEHVGTGLYSKDGTLRGFAIAGSDGKYHNATAKLEGNTVLLWSDKVAKPVSVRFGWADFTDANLYNSAHLPAVPFRAGEAK